MARKIFNVKENDFESLVGKTIVIARDAHPYKITGIMKDVPENSHLTFDILASYNSLYSGGNAVGNKRIMILQILISGITFN